MKKQEDYRRMNIRRAVASDLDAVISIYNEIHTAEEAGLITIGWDRYIYPTMVTAKTAIERDDLFVLISEGDMVGSAIINKMQVDAYRSANWTYKADDDRVMVLHTLSISPKTSGKGYGTAFVEFYETYASEQGCDTLRIDTNARNLVARRLYKKLGYTEVDIIPTVFNGLEGVDLVLLEKRIADKC